ncbi:hypothetical protein V8F20_006255 [Naviculisporaceae sp. PSN 640]
MRPAFTFTLSLIVLLTSQIHHSVCASYFEFRGALSSQDNDVKPDPVYEAGTEIIVSWKTNLVVFDFSLCEVDGSCVYQDRVIVQEHPTKPSLTNVSWPVPSNDELENIYDGHTGGFYLRVMSSLLEQEAVSRTFTISRPKITTGPSGPSASPASTSETLWGWITVTTNKTTVIATNSSVMVTTIPTTVVTTTESSFPAGTQSSTGSPLASSPPPESLNTGTIAGIAVGAVIGAIIGLFTAWQILRKRGITIGVIEQHAGNPSEYTGGGTSGKKDETGTFEAYKRASEIAGTPIFETEGNIEAAPVVRHELHGEGMPNVSSTKTTAQSVPWNPTELEG